MKKQLLALAFAAAVSMSAIGAGAPVPVQTISPIAVPAGKTASAQLSAIRQAAGRLNMDEANVTDSTVLLLYPNKDRAKKFQATIAVDYGTNQIRVRYVKSRGLSEGPCKEAKLCAHRNVNRWLNNLKKEINLNLY